MWNNIKDDSYSVHFLTVGQAGVGPKWKAHSDRILGAAIGFNENEFTTVDSQGLVRIWKGKRPISQWVTGRVDDAASVSIRGDSLMILYWKDQVTSSGFHRLNPWEGRAAAVTGTVFDRLSGKELFQISEFQIVDDDTKAPKSAISLAASELARLPTLSNDGRHLLLLDKTADAYALRCMDVRDGKETLNQSVLSPLRVGFSQDDRQVLTLSSDSEEGFLLSVFDIKSGQIIAEYPPLDSQSCGRVAG